MTIFVQGIGWLTNNGYGRIRTGQHRAFERGEGIHSLPKGGIFPHPFKNFGRLDSIARMTAYAVAQALRDSGIEYSPGLKLDIGIIGTNAEGSLRSDIEYFKDYVESGRTLSRGNLFIYTLPSSPVGESAIHFGLQGPLLYVREEKNSLAQVLDTAADMIMAHDTPMMLVGRAEETEALYVLLAAGPAHAGNGACSFADARIIVETSPDVAGMVEKFEELAARKA
jgi:3-oxoacyl-[acyl-carrier-protein] synthase II